MSANQPVRLSYVWRLSPDQQFSKINYDYKEALSTDMKSSSRVTPFPFSTRSGGLESPSRNRLMETYGKNQGHRSLSSPHSIDIDALKSKTEKPEVGVSKNKTGCPLTSAIVLGVIAAALGLAAVGMSTYILITNQVATTRTSTTTIPTLRWNSTGVIVAGTGVLGTAANQLSTPMGLALDSSNTLYIGDLNNSRVQKWAMGAWTGVTVAGQANGASGSTANSFNQVGGLVVDSTSGIYVADIYNCRILYWPSGASSGTNVAGTGVSGNLNTQLSYPYSLTRDPSSGTLYIADSNNQRVLQYLVGATSGTVVAGGNGQGSNTTQLNYPIGLWFDSSSNSLVIANAGGNNIVRWTLGATNWVLLAGDANGTIGSTSTMLYYPVGVTFDSWGNMYVADTYNHRIQFFLAGQSTGTTIAGVVTTRGNSTALLNFPYNLILDANLNLYVADSMNHRVLKFLRY